MKTGEELFFAQSVRGEGEGRVFLLRDPVNKIGHNDKRTNTN